MRTRSEPRPAPLDRERERAALDDLLTDLRSGRGRALVVRPEARRQLKVALPDRASAGPKDNRPLA